MFCIKLEGPMRILIVDDSSEMRRLEKQYIHSDEGWPEVYEAQTGEEGVDLARTLKPDIVLMDINLPGINGIEAASRIKQDDQKCHIIFLSLLEKNALSSIIQKARVVPRDIPHAVKPQTQGKMPDAGCRTIY